MQGFAAPDQDVHYIQARPSLIAQVRRADLVFCTGADLEVGWLPVLLRQAGNAKVQPGQSGYLEAASAVKLLDVPVSVDRSQGDVHPFGNPHIQTDPRNIAFVAAALNERLQQLDPPHAQQYGARFDDFSRRWRNAMERWTTQGKSLHGMAVVTHHKSFLYLENWLGMIDAANLEPKPGVEPTTGHLSSLIDIVKTQHVQAIVRASYQDSRASEWLASRTGVKAIVVPHTIDSVPHTDSLFELFDAMLAALKAVQVTQ